MRVLRHLARRDINLRLLCQAPSPAQGCDVERP